jgi:hypothetical protein
MHAEKIFSIKHTMLMNSPALTIVLLVMVVLFGIVLLYYIAFELVNSFKSPCCKADMNPKYSYEEMKIIYVCDKCLKKVA